MRLATLGAGICAASIWCLAATAEERETRWITDVGKAYYDQYCQVCHGPGGRGDGPFANALDVAPPDLTRIAQRREGVFSSLEIADYIEGTRAVRGHSSAEMPIWGVRLREISNQAMGQGDAGALRGRIFVLVEYLRSLQAGIDAQVIEEDALPTSSVADIGQNAYLKNCSACHGLSASGDGPLASYLTPRPPDLTRLASRNQGEFPTLSVIETIDGRRAVKAHGDREMPVWGAEFGKRRAGTPGTETAIRGEIQLLVEFLRSVQTD